MRTESNSNSTEQPINNAPQHPPVTDDTTKSQNTYKVIRRNGKLTAFSADKIAIAMTKAFLDVEGKRSAASASIRDKVTHLTQEVVNALFRRSPQGGIVHIEDIQDHVELALMRSGEHKIARSYVLYRERRAQQRAKKEKKAHKNDKPTILHITTATGEQKPLDQQRLQTVIEESTTGLKNADASRIMKGALRNLFDGIPESEVGSALIMSARTLIDQDPDYSYVSARLLLDNMRTEALSFTYGHPRECTQQELGTCYAEYFGKYIKKAAELQHLDEELTRYDLKKLGAALEPERDLNFTYLGLQTLYDRYFIHHDQTRFELPQAFFMRVAMGLAINEIHREERAIEFYKLLSSFRFMSSTPTLFNSGSLRPQLSSCYLTTVPDDLAGIYDAIKDNALLSKFAGGLGNDWTSVRGLGAHIKGTNGKSQGVVPFLKVSNDTAVAVNQGGRRRGAICAYLETWHIDIEEFLELRKNTGDERRRTHDMNSANWIPDGFMKRVAREQDWTLFSPDETPDLHDLYGDAFEKRYAEYEAKAARGEMRLFKTVKAVELWRKMLGMLFETGHPWVVFKDPCNIRYTNQHVGIVHSSNLCTEITLHTDADEIAVCFPKGTQILTQNGQKPIELCDQEQVLVPFNSDLIPQQRFLTATLIPQGKKRVYEILTKNGITICATEEHPFLIQQPVDHKKPKVYEWRKLKELERGDFIVCPLNTSIYDDIGQQDADFTAAGWMLGDGWMSSSYGACFASHETIAQDFVLPILERWHQESPLGNNTPHSAPPTPYVQPNGVVNWHTQRQGFIDYVGKRFGFHRAKAAEKRIAPQIKQADVNQIASFLSGLFSADGCVLNDARRKKGGVGVALSSASLLLLRDVQLLLKPFGIHGRIRGCSVKGRGDRWQGTYEIKNRDSILNFTRFIGFSLTPNKQEKLQGLLVKLSSKSAFQHSAVIDIVAKGEEEVFDLSLNEDHSFIANGLVVHNCNLGSVNLAAHTTADGLDMPMLEKTITTATRMLDNVIEYNYYSVPQARRSNLQHRPVGLGLMGFQDALYKLNIPYATEEAVEFADRSMEAISYYAIQGSNQLAKERGKYSTYDGSLWSRGILPIDSIDLLEQERGEFCQIDKSKTLDWDSLREKISTHGMRNSNVMAIAPTACVSGDTLILSSEGLIPIASLVKGEAQWQNINVNIAQEGNLAHSDQLYLNGFKDTLRITTKRGSEITATPNHRIRVINKEGDYCWKYFFELAVGDEVVRRLGGHQTLLATKAPIKLTLPQRIHHNEKNIQLPETLTADTAFILGLYMGDGYLKYSNRGHYTKKEGLGFAIHNDETTLIEQLRDYFSTWGVTLLADVSKTESACTTYMVFSSQLVKWFESNQFNKQRGNFGEGSASAFIPEKILQSNSNVLCAFLSGLFVADGTVNNRCVEMCTVSRTLALQVKTALESLGIIATLSTSKPGTKGNRPAHRVRTSNIESTKKFATLIGFGSSIKQQRLQQRLASCHSIADARRGHNIRSKAIITEFIKAARSANVDKYLLNPLACSKTNGKMNIGLAQQAIADYPALQATKLAKLLAKGNLYFEPIVSIEASQDVTYDLQVPERHTYVANGFVSHNTISNICGVSQSIEPTYQNMYVKSNLSGEFTVVNPYLINELKALDLWDDVMINDLKYFDGSVQKIDRIPANIKEKYATAFEIDSRWLVEAASRRQKWIDQGESLNLYLAEPSGKKLDDLYKLAWVRGLKTTYYLRTLGATHMEKSADSNAQTETNNAPKVCSILDPDCEACQ